MQTRREIITSGLGLAAIIAAGKAPAAVVRSMVAARNAAMFGGKNLPYDAEVEYLENVGNCRISIPSPLYTDGYTHNYKFQIGVRVFSASAERGLMTLGTANSSSSGPFIMMTAIGNKVAVMTAGTRYNSFVSQAYLEDYLITLNTSRYTTVSNMSTGVAYNLGISSYSDLGENINLFSGPSGLYAQNGVMISHLKVYSDNVLVIDAKSVVKDNVGYMYDRANPTGGPLGNGLYGNAGTGYFDFPGRIS